MNNNVTIQLESPRGNGVSELIRALDDYLSALYPPESNHFLDLAQLAGPSVRFLVARRAGSAVACGALRIDAEGYGEVKRMYVVPAARGQGLGRAILARIEEEARREGLRLLRLETGVRQAEAIALYRACGYVDCPPFGEYRPDPLSRFMEKRL
ncbi:MAG TPA: GNAT family N-acetyltransferase [Burkholderiales bacterium]|nr:GNAT family N-acetyltransferase [Burkholderiales bacterium]